ncbi:Glutamyl-tRNA amidotransferase protein [Pyrenophora tritici-repentis]|uniref:Glutamyl-tRNA amidotransferase protein n=1 Tax=Pyrenophora tritici-repentis TaxID=45151 RepID=A0A922NLG5_9PLEO|nr:Glutamyl-tRNA(Gln) amidotransferase subunit A [Pyrenophora tritici-repentis]KAI1517222.1 Glutamyl-tRNA amidotransferase protein [Pyrenophora tritici-repentis]KAI1670229.1 Glutamyl-tRNA amidotransferase protein [Pyrenophora tritici-repentis]KAI1681844.1 Glutamyl-tRNA amidotransferase protein [Pyrenophora tritici-repentis]
MQDIHQDKNASTTESKVDSRSIIQAASLLRHTPLSTLNQLLKTQHLTSRTLTKSSLYRIASTNRTYNHTIDTSHIALSTPASLDTKLQRRSALHGIPILLKDNMPTLGDGMHTTCGSLALVDAIPSEEAEVVGALRAAGAVVIGKGNMAEWVEFRSTSGCSGWSARGGQTTGLFHPGMKASGSSGGGAVAVGLGVVGVALGTETCYCIVSPAEKSGIIGFKPTRGLLSSKGLIHASKRLDTVGVLARTVADTQLVLTKRPFIKIPRFGRLTPILKEAGATIICNIAIPGARVWTSLSLAEQTVLFYADMKASINTYLTSLNTNPQNITDLASLIAFTKDHPAEQYPHRNVEGLENAQAADTNAPLYKTMPEKNDYFINGEGGIHATLTACCADVMILPTLSPTMQTLAAKAGSPVMSVPMGTLPADTAVEKDEGSGLVSVAPEIP